MAAKSTTATVTAKQVKAGLSGRTAVTANEEQTLRMRYGAQVEPGAPLGRKAAPGSEAADELLLMEMQLLKAYRAHLARTQAPAARAAPTVRNEAKNKIVRALRKKR